MPTVLEEVKASLRISHPKLDEIEIIPMIEQARLDLIVGGVKGWEVHSNNPLVTRAIIHYCRLNFPLNGMDFRTIERLERAYDSAKNSLALADWSEIDV